MSHYQKIYEYMKEHRDEMVRDLSTLAAIPSILGEAEEGAPFGRECARCLKRAAQMFEDYGFETTLYENSGYALASYGQGEAYVGLFGHSDVVPVDEDEWIYTKPFDIIEKEGYLIGRGVSDNKSGVIASLYLMRAVRDLQLPLKHRLVAFIGSNEEAGMGDVQNFVNEQPLPAVSLIPDSGFPVSLGEMGILRVDLTAREPLHDIVALEGGEAYNVVLNRLKCRVRAVEGLKEQLAAAAQQHDFLTVEDQGNELALTVMGVPAHAAAPQGGVNALKRLCDVLCACPALCVCDREQLALIGHALSTCDGSALGYDSQDPVLGDLTSANGIVRLTEGRVMFTLDIRHGVTIDSERIRECLMRGLGAQFELLVYGDAIAFTIDPQNRFALAIMDAFRSATGETEAKHFYMKGGTYCKYLPNAFATGASYRGEAGELELPAGHGGAHQSDERVNINGLLNGTAILGQIALAVAEKID